ncbi:MAG TPA: tRNA lysidine(34) synthetase TilS [Sulfurimonas sp. UBA12504]|nr:MAG: tRNA lysidine(34) synthetase TilS [Sulfurimonas sp. GWF2_37_8]DAB30815.1 MAG TPA: tRNA lysidine(34) synthetase TilS [Sulfurimonas sp. UBA12504]
MLKPATLEKLQNKKNLLAFSAGVDSTTLLFLLLENDIKFDIAIVDYGLREQSKEEVTYAKELAQTYDLTCHTYQAKKIQKNFEAHAREIRYNFFNALIQKHHYQNLLTAHHLGDRFEWMLMQFCKGAGCAEMAGMREHEERTGYTLVRPLLHLDKQEFFVYLDTHKRKYFLDASNQDKTIKRNYFRHNFTNPLMQEHLEGIKKSFAYLEADFDSLIKTLKIEKIGTLAYFSSCEDKRSDIYAIDKYLKTQGYMASANERSLLKKKETLVLGRKFLVSRCQKFIFITAFQCSQIVLPKEFKESCRKLKIEPKLRPFLYENAAVFDRVKELLFTL